MATGITLRFTGKHGQPVAITIQATIVGASADEAEQILASLLAVVPAVQIEVEGSRMGRPRAKIDPALLDAVRNGSISEREGAKRAGVARNTFHFHLTGIARDEIRRHRSKVLDITLHFLA